jgi:hypothetical protein
MSPMTTAEISHLSLREKFQVMEAIWSDLREGLQGATDMPDSHKELLDTRRERVRSGAAKLLDWDEAKHRIGK